MNKLHTTTKPHTVPEQTRKIHAQLLEVRDNMIELQEQASSRGTDA